MTSLVGKKVKVSKSPIALLNRKTGTVIRDISPFGLYVLDNNIYVVEMDRPFFGMKTLYIWNKYLEVI